MSYKSDPNITVIIPLRVGSQNAYLLDRLSYVQLDPHYSAYVKVTVIDDGSRAEFASKVADVCRQNGYGYNRIESQNSVFSIARCRNYGAMHADTRYIFFQDVDLMPTHGFYRRLNNEIGIVGLGQASNNMIMVPVSYLTEEATPIFLSDCSEDRLQYYIEKTIMRDDTVVEKFSSGTSACLYDRYYFLSLGGNREEYMGWGYEDIEFNTRLIRMSKQFPIPHDWDKDISSLDIQTEFRGWKSAYRLFGDRSFCKGLLLFHSWHSVQSATPYSQRRQDNQRLFQKHMREFAAHRQQPSALPDMSSGPTLLFRRNAFTSDRSLMPLLGESKCISENTFSNKDDFVRYVGKHNFRRVLFHNPYANEQMRCIYNWVRQEGIPFIVAERGALNNSVLFDTTGFLADSTLYDAQFWDQPLSPEREARIMNYIWSERSAGTLLESQGQRKSAPELRNALEITSTEKLILVCLQRPGDTATRFFSDEMGSYLEFVDAVERLSRELPENYRILFKIHPLEDDVPDITGINVTDYHLYDLFDLVDSLLIFNSGTGVQAMMWDLPVVTCGKAFYDHERLTHHVQHYDQLKQAVQSELPIYQEERLRFLSYLIEEYYSFGNFVTRQTLMETGEKMTATVSIDFTDLRFEDVNLSYYQEPRVRDGWQSMLFDRYLWQKKGAKASAAATPARQSSAQNNYEKFYNGGCYDFHQKSYKSSIQKFNEAVKLQPNNANVRRVIAEAYFKDGNKKAAIAHLEVAHKLLPDNKAIQKRLIWMKNPIVGLFINENAFTVPEGRRTA